MITTIESNSMPVTKDKKFCYPICFEQDFAKIASLWEEYELPGRKVCIVTDKNVEPLYAEELKKELEKAVEECLIFSFEAGEANKNADTVKKAYDFLIKNHFERTDVLVALGGGVVGDLTGFVAATYLRGIAFVQVPTTLLAQVDSSIGGKTGIDFEEYKNMVGAFYMPKMVYMNMSTLKTLPERQFYAGMGEVLKTALIKDGMFYGWIINNLYEIYEKEEEVLTTMVYNCCNIKRMVVEKDWDEKGERAILNFGHTIGHAIEKAKGFTLLHGECVALGMVAASFIAYKRQLLSFDEYYEIRDMFVPFNLPITVEDVNPEEILAYTKSDKKMQDGKIKFILLKKIGKAYIDMTVTEEELLAGIHEIYVSDEEKYD